MFKLRRFFSLFFESGACSIVGPGKKKGEDAFYTASDMIVVADGVGGWTLSGVDPSKYAWELVQNVQDAKAKIESLSALEILDTAADNCREIGSSTCILLVLDSVSRMIDTINVGDSGFFLYRPNGDHLTLVEKSEELLHGFNFPFQLGSKGDDVISGSRKKFQVHEHDWIIVYTDGLTDNLFEKSVREMLKRGMIEGKNVEEIATQMAEAAIKCSVDSTYYSPFAKAANLYNCKKHEGGKPDDTTVVVAQVRRRE